MDECVKQYTSKYSSRPSPPFPANKCPKRKMVGNDGRMYTSVPDKNGVHRWQLSKDGVDVTTWAALCRSKPTKPFGMDFKLFTTFLEHDVWIKDVLIGDCSLYRAISSVERALSSVTTTDVEIRDVQVPYLKALMPEKTADLILAKIPDTIAFKIDITGDDVVKYRTTAEGYIPLRYSCVRSASGNTRIVEADFDLEPVASLQEVIRRTGADIDFTADVDLKSLKDDMARQRIVYLFLIGKPCDGRDLATECLRNLTESRADGGRVLSNIPPPQIAVAPAQRQAQIALPKRISAKEELDALPVFYTYSFVTERQLSFPTDKSCGVLVASQPPDRFQYVVRFIVNGREDVIERLYNDEKASGKQIYGKVLDEENDKFIGLVGDFSEYAYI